MNRLQTQRTAFGVAAAACLAGCGGGLVGFFQVIQTLRPPKAFMDLAAVPFGLVGLTLVALVGLFVFLALSPRPWGKLVCAVGGPWILFSAMAMVMSRMGVGFPYNPLLLFPGLGGATLLGVGGVLLALDGWRFGV